MRTAFSSLFFFYERAEVRKPINSCTAGGNFTRSPGQGPALPLAPGRSPGGTEAPQLPAALPEGPQLPALDPAGGTALNQPAATQQYFLGNICFGVKHTFGRFLRTGRILVTYSIALPLSFSRSLPPQHRNRSQSTAYPLGRHQVSCQDSS